MDDKGQVFQGYFAGKNYDRFSPLLGMHDAFYNKAVGDLSVSGGMRVMDLGCGTGRLLFALAAKTPDDVVFTGCDYSPDQLARAEQMKSRFKQNIAFMHSSMDEVDFPDGHFNVIMSSMAMHAVSPKIRAAAIFNCARMLKKGGQFLFVDLGKPRFSFLGALFAVMHRKQGKDSYAIETITGHCVDSGLALESDQYINPLVRRQVFRKV